MATQGGDIRFTFTGDSSGLNSELKKIDKEGPFAEQADNY